MEKYIVAIQPRVRVWFRLFDEVFRTDEFQRSILTELVTMSSWLAIGQIKNDARLELNESVHHYVTELAEQGFLDPRDISLATQTGRDLCTELAGHLIEIGVLGKEARMMKFQGFLNWNLVVKVLDGIDDEFDKMDERVWLTG